ncbi:hypothetical protein DIPPA_13343 [Diplonema papillatum]|nr:hypothetical protein DIPPA_13343 [Diplonema papillatum]
MLEKLLVVPPYRVPAREYGAKLVVQWSKELHLGLFPLERLVALSKVLVLGVMRWEVLVSLA